MDASINGEFGKIKAALSSQYVSLSALFLQIDSHSLRSCSRQPLITIEMHNIIIINFSHRIMLTISHYTLSLKCYKLMNELLLAHFILNETTFFAKFIECYCINLIKPHVLVLMNLVYLFKY